MLLVIDVGNTNIVFGLFAKEKLLHHFRVATRVERTADEYGALLSSLCTLHGYSCYDIKGVMLSSVVPAADRELLAFGRHYCATLPLVVGPGIKTGMAIRYENPKEVGADRIVNAVAAYEQIKGAAIVVDFGTATTFDLIGTEGDYCGGVIAPGIWSAMDVLTTKTAKLPKIDFVKPQSIIGRNTVDSMRAGLYWGYVALVDGILRQMTEETKFKKKLTILATGGLAKLLSPDIKRIEIVDELLTLTGLRIIYERNR